LSGKLNLDLFSEDGGGIFDLSKSLWFFITLLFVKCIYLFIKN
jgi:hypothetical protein